jgi:hypothetical protein
VNYLTLPRGLCELRLGRVVSAVDGVDTECGVGEYQAFRPAWEGQWRREARRREGEYWMYTSRRLELWDERGEGEVTESFFETMQIQMEMVENADVEGLVLMFARVDIRAS